MDDLREQFYIFTLRRTPLSKTRGVIFIQRPTNREEGRVAAFGILSNHTRRCLQESQEASKVKHNGSFSLDRSLPTTEWKGRRKGLVGVS